MGLLADGTVGHGAGLESFDNLGPGFHLGQGHGGIGQLEFKLAADKSFFSVNLVYCFPILPPRRFIVLSHGLLQQGYGGGIVLVGLAVPAPFVAAAGGQ